MEATRKSGFSGKNSDSLDVVTDELKQLNFKDKRQPSINKLEEPNSKNDNSEPEGVYLELQGFDRGLIPEKIVGATNNHGVLLFLIKWKDTDTDLIPAALAKLRCLNLVVDFYEERITWPRSSTLGN